MAFRADRTFDDVLLPAFGEGFKAPVVVVVWLAVGTHDSH